MRVWVNNAGVLAVGDAATMTESDVRRMVEINLLGVIWGCQAALATTTVGTILNIASMSALDPASDVLFSAGKMLTLDEVADAAVDLVDHARLVRTMPAYRAALIHVLRPFPSLGLTIVEQFAKLGRRRKR